MLARNWRKTEAFRLDKSAELKYQNAAFYLDSQVSRTGRIWIEDAVRRRDPLNQLERAVVVSPGTKGESECAG